MSSPPYTIKEQAYLYSSCGAIVGRVSSARFQDTMALSILMEFRIVEIKRNPDPRASSITKTGLARRLAVPDTEARRLLDLDHPTEMDRLERVLKSFGVELVVTTRKPAA